MLACALTCILSSTASAQPPTPLLRTLWPSVGSLGQTIDIAVRGENLAEDASLICSDSRIVAELRTDAAAANAGERVFTLQIPADANAGLVDFRIRTAAGISNPKRFSVVVGPSRASEPPAVETDEKADSSSPNHPELSLGETLHSVCLTDRPAMFTVQFDQDQPVDITCHTISVDSELLAYLTIRNSDGNVVHQRAAAKIADLTTTFTAPRSDRYLITIHDQLYRGGEPFFFHFIVKSSKSYRQLQLPKNNSVSQPDSPLAVGGSIQGVFDSSVPAGVEFEFDAIQQDQWAIEVYSRRFGAATDPELILNRVRSDAANTPPRLERVLVVDDRDYLPGSLLGYRESDPGSLWTVPENGRYRIQIRDLQTSSEPEANKEYCLAIRKPVPDVVLRTIIPDSSFNVATAPAGTSLLRGGRLAIEVAAFEIDAFLQQNNPDGTPRELIIAPLELPVGVAAEPLRLSRHQPRGHLILHAADDCASAAAAIQVIAKANVVDPADSAAITRPADPWTVQLADPDGRGRALVRPTDTLWIATDDRYTAPLAVRIETGETVLSGKVGTTLEIPITISRQAIAAAKITVRATDLPPNVTASELVLEGETLSGVITLTIPANTPIATFSVFVNAETEVAWAQPDGSNANRRWFTPSNPVEIRIDA